MDILGYRAKVGIVAASYDTVSLPSMAPLMPPGATLHVSDYAAGPAPLRDRIEAALTRMAAREPTIVGILADEELTDPGAAASMASLAAGTAAQPVLLPSAALAAAAEKTGWTARVGLISPFDAAAGAAAAARLRTLGFDIVAEQHMDFKRPADAAAVTFVALRQVYAKLLDAGIEHVVQLGHHFPFVKLVGNLEEDFGKPILSINQVCLWHLLRRAYIEDLSPYAGRLFLDY